MKKIVSIISAALVIGVSVFSTVATSGVYNGQGNCIDSSTTGWIKQDTGGTSVTINAATGDIINSVTVKAGSAQSTGGDQCHTYTTNGSDGCYSVSGIGTGSVTVTKVGSGSDCKDISHLEGIQVSSPPQECTNTVDGTPGAWSNWVSNGNGTETRTRTIPLLDATSGASCGSRQESETRNIACYQTVDGTPGAWSDWVDNGNGTETRTRTIPLLDSLTGASCGSRQESQTQDIPTEQCTQTVDGTPGAWSNWVDNGNGTQTRTRTIPLVDANNSDVSCGSRTESQTVPIPPSDPYCSNGKTIFVPAGQDPPEGATPGNCTPPVKKKLPQKCGWYFDAWKNRNNVETVIRWMSRHPYYFCPAWDPPTEKSHPHRSNQAVHGE